MMRVFCTHQRLTVALHPPSQTQPDKHTAVRPVLRRGTTYKRIARIQASMESDVMGVSSLTQKASTMSEVKSYLLSLGWDLNWVDGVTAEIMKKKLDTSASKCRAVVEYLKSLGIENHRVENMVSIAKQVLSKTPEELQTVVAWIQSKGISGNELVVFLETNPVVLTYAVSESNEYLEKEKARISLVKTKRDGTAIPEVVYWREGTAFGTAPVSPILP